MIKDCRYQLVNAGISMPDADQLRRIAMTLHRWHEWECGDGNSNASWCITRGRKERKPLPDLRGMGPSEFVHDDNGSPYMETHWFDGKTTYQRIADRERGALKRLKAIMARYPELQAYVQTDPRGASLYILPPGVNADNYNRGIAVHK
jgi:hypothetical protein